MPASASNSARAHALAQRSLPPTHPAETVLTEARGPSHPSPPLLPSMLPSAGVQAGRMRSARRAYAALSRHGGVWRHDGGACQEEPCQPSVVLGAAAAARVRGDRGAGRPPIGRGAPGRPPLGSASIPQRHVTSASAQHPPRPHDLNVGMWASRTARHGGLLHVGSLGVCVMPGGTYPRVADAPGGV